MSRFYVGQRVRVVCHESNINGAETTVRGIDIPGIHNGKEYLGIQVSERKRLDTERYPYFVFENHELEPIIDPGRELVKWSECLWQPEGVSA